MLIGVLQRLCDQDTLLQDDRECSGLFREGCAKNSASPCRWKATPLNVEQWKAWFKEQADLAGAKIDRGLYISLRLDGRVRGSGLGPPPWQRLIAQLPKAEGEQSRAQLSPNS